MKNHKLIELLKSMPADIDVCIFDYRKNGFEADEDGSSVGIHKVTGVRIVKGEKKNFIALPFTNSDYTKDLEVNEGSLIYSVIKKQK